MLSNSSKPLFYFSLKSSNSLAMEQTPYVHHQWSLDMAATVCVVSCSRHLLLLPILFPFRVYVYNMPPKFTYDLLWLFKRRSDDGVVVGKGREQRWIMFVADRSFKNTFTHIRSISETMVELTHSGGWL
ncbi:hypothetical protein RJT34_09849 [Clitoria ternatea]|uniref:Uncharacterized protein n=1 Tax=Clitoria ternatea TaxID=43366 RepID=A0AAN9PWM5_CLITE